MNQFKPWPKCFVIQRDGTRKPGEIAHDAGEVITVRFDELPWEVPGTFGREVINFSYKDVARKYVEFV